MPVPFPWPSFAAACGAVLLAVLPGPLALGVAAAVTCLAVTVLALRNTQIVRVDVGLLAWVAAPIGVALATIAATLERVADPTDQSGMVGAAIAAAAIVTRGWLDGRAREPVRRAIHDLQRTLPLEVRVPVSDVPTEEVYEKVPAVKVRAGQEVMALENEVVAIDGVVLRGEALVVLHPSARTAVRRKAGQPVIAGARVLEGAIRLLSTRVGKDRALVRPERFGRGSGQGAARIAKLAEQTTRWGGLAAVAGAVGGLALTGNPGLAGQLTAAAAVLVAVPLLAARRSADGPLVAGAASAAERGIIFHDARTLEDAGRVAVTVLNARGTVTEGALEVIEVQPIGEVELPDLVGWIAGAERAAPTHPIAAAVNRFARSRGFPIHDVRRTALHAGRGVTGATSDGKALVVGNRQLLLDEGVSVAVAESLASRAEERGHTALFASVGGRVAGVVSLQDTVKNGARAAVQRIFDLGVDVVLVSGDHRATVSSLARALDVGNVKSDLVPSERGDEVRSLKASGGLVASVGHADIDQDALNAADVAIQMGAAGVASGEGSIALATEDVRDASAALFIARAARRAATRNVFASVGVGGVLVAAAAFGWLPVAAAAISALALDAFTLPAGQRLLRRVKLRVPARA